MDLEEVEQERRMLSMYRESMTKLREIWTDIGLEHEKCTERRGNVVTHLGVLLTEMIDEETENRCKLQKKS